MNFCWKIELFVLHFDSNVNGISPNQWLMGDMANHLRYPNIISVCMSGCDLMRVKVSPKLMILADGLKFNVKLHFSS